MTTLSERVARGVAFLDEHEPGWDQRIDLEKLNLGEPCQCVLGQLATDYTGALWSPIVERFGLRLGPEDHPDSDFTNGFNAGGDQSEAEYDELTAEWRRVIEARRSGGAA